MPSSDINENCFTEDHHFSLRIPPLDEIEPHQVFWLVSGLFTIVACINAFVLMIQHWNHYARPDLQRYVVRIMLMVPIYAIDSWFSFRLHWWSAYFNVIRDCYEAFVIYNFFTLLMNMLGGYEQTKDLFEHYPPMRMPPPLCFLQIRTKRALMGHCRRLVLQYIIVRPTTTLIAASLQVYNNYCAGNMHYTHGYIYLTAANFASVTCAMYGLVLFYLVARHELKPFNPLAKFFSIKFVIFLCFWQTIIIFALTYFQVIRPTKEWNTSDIGEGIQNFALCVEMFLVSVVNFKAFKFSEYHGEKIIETPVWPCFVDTINPMDIVHDIKHSFHLHVVEEKINLLTIKTNNNYVSEKTTLIAKSDVRPASPPDPEPADISTRDL